MHQNTPAPLPRAALEAAERGWHVIPLVRGGKRPAIRSWEPRATTDPERITRCWSTGDYNLGIVTGPSRLIVVDLDVPKHVEDAPPAGTPSNVTCGGDALALLAEECGECLPSETYSVRTGSGGLHLYFAAPSETRLRNTAGTLGWKIDTRASGGYVVGAGSIVNGNRYDVVHDVPPAPLPTWLTQLLIAAPLPSQSRVTVPLAPTAHLDSYLRSAVDGEVGRVTRAHEGQRNNALYQASVALGQLAAGGALTPDEVTAALTPAALRIGLPELDIHRTIASGLRTGAKRPRTIGRRAA
jgi:hypothetical protein